MSKRDERVGSEKSSEIIKFLDAVWPHGYGHGVCGYCGADVSDDLFRDEISLKEYTISGLCQSCQDWVFDEE